MISLVRKLERGEKVLLQIPTCWEEHTEFEEKLKKIRTRYGERLQESKFEKSRRNWVELTLTQ